MRTKLLSFLKSGSLILCVTSAFSYLMGLIRDRSFAHIFGASVELDAYNAAFILPDFILNLFVAGALSAAFIPVFTEQLSKGSSDKARLISSSVLNLALLLLIFIITICFTFLPFFKAIIVPGFDSAQADLWLSLTRVMLISPFIFAVSNIGGSILVSHERFLAYGISPILYNLGIILGAIYLSPHFGIMGVAYGTIIGAFLHLSVRWITIERKLGRFFGPVLAFPSEVRQVLKLMLPKMVGLGVWQLHLMAFTALVSTLTAGSLVVYSFARNFQSVPVSLIGIAIATASFPILSKHASLKEGSQFFKTLGKKSLLIIAFTVPAAFLLAFLGGYLIDLLLGGGRFDAEAVSRTATVLKWYSLAIPLESLMHLLSRAFYAQQNTIIPVSIRVVGLGSAVLLAWQLIASLGILAIPISFALGMLLEVVLLSLILLVKYRPKPQLQ